jgi:hypothetical protein
MYLYVRKCCARHAISQRVSGVVESGWIHDEAIYSFAHGLVNAIDGLAFEDGVENFQLVPSRVRVVLEHRVSSLAVVQP